VSRGGHLPRGTGTGGHGQQSRRDRHRSRRYRQGWGRASPDQAIICDPGSGYYSWLAVSKPWKVTHATRYEHFVHSTGTFTRTAAFQRQLSAKVTYTVKVSGALQTPIFSLGSQTSLTLEADGKATTTSAISIKETMDDYAVFIYYDGSREVSGNFIYHRCNAAGTAYRVTSIGDARSYTSPAEGAFNCNTTPPAGSLGAVVKPQYC